LSFPKPLNTLFLCACVKNIKTYVFLQYSIFEFFVPLIIKIYARVSLFYNQFSNFVSSVGINKKNAASVIWNSGNKKSQKYLFN